MQLSPIVLFVYNRLEHTKKTIEALKNNNLAINSELFIFSDAPKNEDATKLVMDVREYIKTITGFKKITIITREKNFGLANSIITGVTEIIKNYGKIIVLEDDIIISPVFLEYMNLMLNKYINNKNIYSVTGYNHPPALMKIPSNYSFDIYFCNRACSWSWGTWNDRWSTVDWQISDYDDFKNNKKMIKLFNSSGNDKVKMLEKQMSNKIDSWAIRWDYHHFKNDAFCVYPVKSYINNIGNDLSGVHSGKTDKYNNNVLNSKMNLIYPDKIVLNSNILNNFKKVYKISILKILINKTKKILFNINNYKKEQIK